VLVQRADDERQAARVEAFEFVAADQGVRGWARRGELSSRHPSIVALPRAAAPYDPAPMRLGLPLRAVNPFPIAAARAALRWALGLVLVFVVASGAPALAPPDALRSEPLAMTEALTVEGERPAFDDPARVIALSLPDDWDRTRPASDGPVWYRLGFKAFGVRESGDLLALYVGQVCSNLEVWLNGQRVHSGGRMQPPYPHLCNHPQLVPLPAAMVRAEDNVIDIKVAGHRLGTVGSRHRAAGLSDLRIGPQSLLAPLHARQTALAVGVPQAISATLVLMGGFMFVLGFVNRRDSHLAYFGAMSVGWAIVDARLWLRQLPLSNPVAEFLLVVTLGFIALAAIQFLLRLVRFRHRFIDIGLPLQCAAIAVSLVIAGEERLYPVASFWYALLAIEVAAAAVFHLRRQWRRGREAFWQMAPLLAAAAVAGAIEFAAQKLGARPQVALWASVVLPVLFVVVGLRLVRQQGIALVDAEADKALLEARVREATEQIERNFRQLAELRVEQVTDRERKRIAADLHDDLGAKLLTIVHTSDSERISTLAREALEEMRLSVRGLTGRAVRLSDALGDWRAEVVSRLAQAGVEASWAAPEELAQMLSARAYVQTTRILREATSNIIKHSGARNCQIVCSIADGDFLLVVQDDGKGIPMELDGRLDRGHGMMSMKQRAKQLQGQCLVESGPGFGTVIRLTLPLDRALEGA
jgi:signal transduction histidine kinase